LICDVDVSALRGELRRIDETMDELAADELRLRDAARQLDEAEYALSFC
jgi:hypothetical protein